MATPNGEVYGFVTPESGIYINPERMNIQTPIHEFGHLLLDLVKNINNECDVVLKGKQF